MIYGEFVTYGKMNARNSAKGLNNVVATKKLSISFTMKI